MIRAVLWDFGGVLTTSPFEAFRRFERERQLPQDFIRGINSRDPDTNAWARFERGDLSGREFDRLFREEALAAGHDVRGADVLALLGGDLRPEMLEALRRCGARLRNACLTNNFRPPAAPDAPEAGSSADTGETSGAARLGLFDRVRSLFDVIVESSVIGVRKPDPQFYQHALAAVAAAPEECVFLDDLGINLKPARALGIHTIKVTDPAEALDQLEAKVGFALR